jgi:hypothetical protein
LVLAAIAIGLHIAGLTEYGRAVQTIARSVKLSKSERAATQLTASDHVDRGRWLITAGLECALASLGSVVISVRRGEPARRAWAYGLLAAYVTIQFLIV